MGKGSNVQKAQRARADAAKRKAAEGQGGGGSKGIDQRRGTKEDFARAAEERAAKKALKEKLKAEKAAKEAKTAKALAKRRGETGQKKKKKGGDDLSFLDDALANCKVGGKGKGKKKK